ncbi:hypothetical protein EJ06DRAFT_414763 [Trichodelitschia bisporula]|uniref:Uncharacterized protein n=1 Tax=Trichodelitschia bisporula TaxID=703511 RepID=A0A6G1HY46_9PEZI|nr:hypothetical protein EJ06DRAFT_414763 [Trichodelitschia bisporula]
MLCRKVVGSIPHIVTQCARNPHWVTSVRNTVIMPLFLDKDDAKVVFERSIAPYTESTGSACTSRIMGGSGVGAATSFWLLILRKTIGPLDSRTRSGPSMSFRAYIWIRNLRRPRNRWDLTLGLFYLAM